MTDREKPQYSENNPSSATLCHTNLTYTARGANPSISSEKQTINRDAARRDLVFVRQRNTKSNL